MNDSSQEILKAPAKRLSQIMKLGLDQTGQLTPDDLRSVLEAQLDSPIHEVIGLTAQALERNMQDTGITAEDLPGTLRELMQQQHPPLPLLELVKDFAKRCREQVDHPVPSEVATLLYYLCIAVALNRHNKQIARLSAVKIKDGFNWVQAQPWIDNDLKQYFAGENRGSSRGSDTY